MKSSLYFALLFVVCMLVQSFVWHAHDFADEKVWTTRTEHLADDLRQHPLTLETQRYSGHPGMTALMPAALLHIAGMTSNESLLWSLAIVNGAIVTSIFFVARKLKPDSAWWIAAGIIVLIHPLHLQATPTNTVTAALAVLVVLLTWYVYKRPETHQYLLVLGVTLGAELASRFTFAGALCLAVGIFLLPRIKKRMLFLVGIALVAFIVIDPIMWSDPADHIMHMLGRANAHFSASTITAFRYSDFVLFAPFAFLSLFAWLLLSIPRFKTMQPLPRPVGMFVFLFTLAISSVYLNAQDQSLRYFFPLIFIWEALLPLFLIALASRVTFTVAERYKRPLQKFFPAGVALSVAAAQLILLLYSLHLPTENELLDWNDISPRIKPHSQQNSQ